VKVVVNKGGYEDFLSRIEAIERYHPVASDAVAYVIAEKLFNLILDHIRRQDLPWPPLDPDYEKWKEQTGLDTRMWIATGELAGHISIWKLPRRQGTGYAVGIPRNLEHTGSGLKSYILATILELGAPDIGLPARPVFRPSIQELRIWLAQNKPTLVRRYMTMLGSVPLRLRPRRLPPGTRIHARP
jgi:hypothetical protein